MISFNMRRPSKPDYDDALSVEVRRHSFWERLFGAWWLLFCNWTFTPSKGGK
jgi:hypothetical protein